MISDHEFATQLTEAMEEDDRKGSEPLRLRPGKVASAVEAAASEDTNRATRAMSEQMHNIIAGLENDIKEASEVRDTITRRIGDLNTALNACRASMEVLKGVPVSDKP